jgi:chromosome segregation ATPase
MEHEFTAEEIRDAAKTARVYCHGFTEDMFESLMELERRIADSGYLEAVMGLIRLEEEKGISFTEALDACEELLEQKAKLESEVPDLEKRADSLVAQLKQATGEYEQVKKDVAKARQELEQIRNEYVAAEKIQEAFNKKAENEKQRIEKEVEDCYQQANVTKEEVVTAGKVKAEVESHGFTLGLVLDLSKEFAGHKDARKELAEGLKAHGSLNKYLDNLYDGATKERTRVLAEIAGLESQKKGLADENIRLGNVLSQLQADIAGEETLRQFYNRYAGSSGLLEKLATWDQVYFMRCGHPFYTAAGILDKKLGSPHFWTDKLPVSCPHCGYPRTYFDTEIYQYLNWPAEAPFKLTLGE